MPHPGIAIITYKRPQFLERCLSSIAKLTPEPHDLIVMCDADDDVDSEAICKAHGVDAVFAANRGVVWNKNRGLFHFMSRTNCDPILLLEDDTCPAEAGWLDQWVKAAARWDHVNFSYATLFASEQLFPSGDGTPEQPHFNHVVSGQCTAVSRHAMRTGGYLDTRFKGYGHGHVEWSRRHASLLYKGKVEGFSEGNVLFLSIDGGLLAADAPTFRNGADVTRNHDLLKRTMKRTPDYLEPWQSDDERLTLIKEVGAPDGPEPAKEAGPHAPAPIYRGYVDVLSGRHDSFLVMGWAVRNDGSPVSSFLLKIGDRTIVDKVVRRVNRPDVAKVHPDAALGCGFELSFELSEEETAAFSGFELSVTPIESGIVGNSLHVAQKIVWPPEGWQPMPDAPTMPADGARRLEEIMAVSRCYLEYGAGGSTVKACEIGVPVILSVESDRAWLDAVARKIAKRRSASELIPLHVDLGPVKDWGFPVADTHWKNYSNYPLLAWEQCIKRGLKPDLVLIDGRFRVACFMATLLFAQQGCRILFDDYGDRPECAVVERFARPSAMIGRVAEFVVPAEVPRDDAWLTFVQASSDVG
ncbi:MAG: glycosyltransferase [Hyphomicrobiales bacterium]|nr:glycosyltransferase [Hyphomicrobiales bacterium]